MKYRILEPIYLMRESFAINVGDIVELVAKTPSHWIFEVKDGVGPVLFKIPIEELTVKVEEAE